MPLADKARPKDFDGVAGQRHLLGENSPLRRMLAAGHLPSMVFYGPPGTGKTTVADIIAHKSDKFLQRINATTASLSDIKAALAAGGTLAAQGGILLYIDEIQYFNKKQQQSLLEYVEDGRVTLICSTTDNPFFCIYPALLSRSAVFEFKSVAAEDIVPVLRRGLKLLCEEYEEKNATDELLLNIARSAGGDVRKSLGLLESVYFSCGDTLEQSVAEELAAMAGLYFDRGGDQHFDCLSALHKSIRGSDPDAAVHYLCRALTGGDLNAVCRRLLCAASEDIGLAAPMAVSVVNACVESAHRLGMPEARLPLVEAAIYLATLPKSNSAYMAYDRAYRDIAAGLAGPIPRHLQNVHADGEGEKRAQGYKYPHDYPNHYVKQQYLPDGIKDRVYYEYGNNKTENAAQEYHKKLTGKG